MGRYIKKASLLLMILAAATVAKAQPMKSEKPFLVGEKLEYLMHYGWIDGGEASLLLTDTTYLGSSVLHAYIKAETAGIAQKLYNLLNIYESWFDPNNYLPVRAKVHKREGPKYKYADDISYNHEQNYVISNKKGKVKVAENCLDVVSAFYFIRQIDFNKMKKGQTLELPTFFLGDPYNLKVVYMGTETVSIELGNFLCHKLMPVTSGSSFEADDSMTIFITDDTNGIPVQIKMDLWVGSLKMDLISHKGLKVKLESVK